jgi:hypothetical protein
MKRKLLKQSIVRGSRSIVVISMIIIGMMSCAKKHDTNSCGFTLQRFEVIDSKLSSLISGIQDSTWIQTHLSDENKVLILILSVYDDCPEFVFGYSAIEIVSDRFIFYNNRRIVGYIDVDGSPLIVLSTIASQYSFINMFYRFLIPTEEKKYFPYIHFPDDLYCLPDENGIPCPPMLFDPLFHYFVYKEGEFVYLE